MVAGRDRLHPPVRLSALEEPARARGAAHQGDHLLPGIAIFHVHLNFLWTCVSVGCSVPGADPRTVHVPRGGLEGHQRGGEGLHSAPTREGSEAARHRSPGPPAPLARHDLHQRGPPSLFLSG